MNGAASASPKRAEESTLESPESLKYKLSISRIRPLKMPYPKEPYSRIPIYTDKRSLNLPGP